MIRPRRCLVVALVNLALAPLAQADFSYLNAGDTQLVLNGRLNWYAAGLYQNGLEYMAAENGSTNGTVLQVDGAWTGGAHYGEELGDARLTIDGAEVDLLAGVSYEGDRLVLERDLVLGSAYGVTHRLTLVDGLLTNDYTFVGLDAARAIGVFYASLGTRSNRLTEAELLDDGIAVASAVTAGDDRATHVLSAGVDTFNAIRQHDPLTGDALVTTWQAPGGGLNALDADVFIWDRDADNKLYLRARAFEGSAVHAFSLRESIRIVPDIGASASAAGLFVPEPSSAVLLTLCLAGWQRRYR